MDQMILLRKKLDINLLISMIQQINVRFFSVILFYPNNRMMLILNPSEQKGA